MHRLVFGSPLSRIDFDALVGPLVVGRSRLAFECLVKGAGPFGAARLRFPERPREPLRFADGPSFPIDDHARVLAEHVGVRPDLTGRATEEDERADS